MSDEIFNAKAMRKLAKSKKFECTIGTNLKYMIKKQAKNGLTSVRSDLSRAEWEGLERQGFTIEFIEGNNFNIRW